MKSKLAYVKRFLLQPLWLLLLFVFSASTFSVADQQSFFARNSSVGLAFNSEISNGHWEKAAAILQIRKASEPNQNVFNLLLTELEINESGDDHELDDDDVSAALPAWCIRIPGTASLLSFFSSGSRVSEAEKRPLYLLYHAWKSFLG